MGDRGMGGKMEDINTQQSNKHFMSTEAKQSKSGRLSFLRFLPALSLKLLLYSQHFFVFLFCPHM